MNRQKSRAFTLVELLVVIAIIGVLVALLLPAVQAAREAARRTQCCNNIRQVSLALINFNEAKKILPSGSSCFDDKSCGVDRGYYGCPNWFMFTLPFIEGGAKVESMDLKTFTYKPKNAAAILNQTYPGMSCPSDPFGGMQSHNRFIGSGCPDGTQIAGLRGDPTSNSMGETYVPCAGPVWPGDSNSVYPLTWPDSRNCQPGVNSGFRNLGSPGMFAGGRKAYKIKDCTDGTAHTFLIGEQLPAICCHQMLFHSHVIVGSTYFPPNYHQIQGIKNEANHFAIANAADAETGYKSEHPGGMHMGMTDGSVHFVSENIDYRLWVFLGARADGELMRLP